jgi:4-aminobutyrate aminotransferase-like enzyme
MSGAYHGHTNSLIDISPYKFFGSGGAGKKDFVHVIPMPDEFAGEHLDAESNFSDYYITVLKNKIDKIKKDGKKLAFFIIEPIMGCGGQVIIPSDFMKEAFVLVKEAGGLFIVDEVQIGFGRIGTHFWGFEMSSVKPDIVTLGKSIGNGHPLSAVITTKHIAETFNNGMEYFNSFGGNPVSCKIGQSVLDIIEEEGLQNNAQEAGKYLLNGLNLLQQKNSLIGDVRGRGLFIGVEIIKNNNKLSPDAIVADKIVNALRQKRVLISSDGPNHNVLKIKPPMVFNIQDADYLLESLEAVLKKIIR